MSVQKTTALASFVVSQRLLELLVEKGVLTPEDAKAFLITTGESVARHGGQTHVEAGKLIAKLGDRFRASK